MTFWALWCSSLLALLSETYIFCSWHWFDQEVYVGCLGFSSRRDGLFDPVKCFQLFDSSLKAAVWLLTLDCSSVVTNSFLDCSKPHVEVGVRIWLKYWMLMKFNTDLINNGLRVELKFLLS